MDDLDIKIPRGFIRAIRCCTICNPNRQHDLQPLLRKTLVDRSMEGLERLLQRVRLKACQEDFNSETPWLGGLCSRTVGLRWMNVSLPVAFSSRFS